MESLPVGRINVVPRLSVVAVEPASFGALRLVATPAQNCFAEVVDLFCRLRLLERWQEMRGLLAADARLESIAARGIAGPGETIEAMRFAAAGERYSISAYEIESLADAVVVVHAWLHCAPPGEDALAAFWLASGKGGLIRRARIVASREEGELILDREGDGLGL